VSAPDDRNDTVVGAAAETVSTSTAGGAVDEHAAGRAASVVTNGNGTAEVNPGEGGP
jgi:hypothetical protein